MDLTSPQYAQELDRQDELAGFRSRFEISDEDLIYVDGNSLGRMPSATPARMGEILKEQWGAGLVRGWSDWIHIPSRLGSRIAEIIGADEDEVLCCDSTSVNLFKLIQAAMRLQEGRSQIVTDNLNFPSDLYVMQGCIPGTSRRLSVVPSEDDVHGNVEAIERELSTSTALLSLTHVAFKSGYMYDMRRLTESAHRVGALALWDLSHSVGAVPLSVRSAGVDLAVGCTYKYLNGGPGSPAFVYVRRELQERLLSPIWGWFGDGRPFKFDLSYEPAPGIRRFNAGTPPILSMAAVEVGVDLVLEAGIDRLRAKSVKQTEYLIELYDALLAPHGVKLNSPREAAVRGSHVSFGHPEGLRVDRALIEAKNVIPDFRAPDTIRFGCTPLYTTFSELRQGVVRMAEVIRDRTYLDFTVEGIEVT